jgi:hypothetical protein
MPQISLYIDQAMLDKVSALAARDHVSLSKWVASCLRASIRDEYPEDYFTLYGAAVGAAFERPEQPGFGNDAPRAEL